MTKTLFLAWQDRTDSRQWFPVGRLDADPERPAYRFFLHGWRHVNPRAQERLDDLKHGDELYVAIELTNPRTLFAVQIQTTDYFMIGWAPRYLVVDLVKAITDHPWDYTACVVRINPQPAPSKQRVLIEMRGKWNDYEPMNGSDYQPVVGD